MRWRDRSGDLGIDRRSISQPGQGPWTIFRGQHALGFAAIITQITPLFLTGREGNFGDNPGRSSPFAAMMVLQLIWVLTKVPETKGVSLEELEKKLIR